MSDFNLLRRYHQDTRANAQSGIIGLICRKGLGTSRADISGSGRQSCEPEFNYKGCEQSRPEMERWKILHSAKDLGMGITNYFELLMHKTLQNKKLAVLTLN